MSIQEELLRRAREYTQRHGLALGDILGSGVHGTVFAAESQPEKGENALHAAIKVHQYEPDYGRERDAYLRLQENELSAIGKCHVPELLRFDDELWVIEMTVVARPFVLDFAGAFLDKRPDFSEEVIADWRSEKIEQFGARWPEVESIIRFLENYEIYLVDVSPSNISLPTKAAEC
jgi:hypothetical protein